MKKLIVFYSYSGHTKAIAHELAAKESIDMVEIKDVRRPGKLKAYAIGCFAAMRGKTWPVQPPDVEWEAYDHYTLLAPVWAGNPPPAFNNVLEIPLTGKSVAVKMVSTSGKSSCKQRLEAAVKAKGGIWESFEDIKA